MPRKAQPRIVRPSGIEQSANGSYFYWKCNVSGQETFAPEPRFNDVVKNYGSEEKLFKEYVLRPVQKYVDAGWDSAAIQAILISNDGKLPPLDQKPVKATKATQEKKQTAKKTAAVSVEVATQPEQPKVLIFPWSGNPDYFRSAPSVFKIEDETKNSCVYPNRNLNDRCFGCSVYDACQSSVKYSVEDMKKTTSSAKVTKLKSF
jgi:hypothetical protein